MENETPKVDLDKKLAVVKTDGNVSALQYSTRDFNLIKDMYSTKCSPQEFGLFIHLAKEYELDVLKREIWMVKFGNRPAQIFVGRDGFRTIAHRSGKFAGMKTFSTKLVDEPITIKYFDKKANKEIPFKRDFSYSATCLVYVKGIKIPFERTVYEIEYSTGRDLWATKSRTMIEKVAQCQTLREAFSISGVVDPVEVEKDPVTPEYVIEDMPTRALVNKLLQDCKNPDELEAAYTDFCFENGKKSLTTLSGKQGNNTETWEDLFSVHRDRVNGVQPFDANKIPEGYEVNEDGQIENPELDEGLDNAVQ